MEGKLEYTISADAHKSTTHTAEQKLSDYVFSLSIIYVAGNSKFVLREKELKAENKENPYYLAI